MEKKYSKSTGDLIYIKIKGTIIDSCENGIITIQSEDKENVFFGVNDIKVQLHDLFKDTENIARFKKEEPIVLILKVVSSSRS